MKETKKRTWLFWVVGLLIFLVAAGLLFLVLTKEKIGKRTDIAGSAEVQSALLEVNNEEVKGIFFSMFPLDSYDVNDFLTYRGIQTIMLEKQLKSGEEVLDVLELTLAEDQTLEAVYIGLSMDGSEAMEKVAWGGLAQIGMDMCLWDEELLEIVKAHPEIRFHIILEYSSIYEVAELSPLKRTGLYKWYYDMAELFTPQGEYQNMVLFLPEAESWLVANKANYLENGEPNQDAAGFALGQMICKDSYTLTKRNRYEKLAKIEAMVDEAKELPQLDSTYTYVFFGDSVIGNYTNSMSIPEIVGGYTGARTINCGYGGLSATKKDENDFGISGIIDAFLSGEYEHFEDDKPVKTGIPAFYNTLSEINTEKLVFFISMGLNDYMSGCPLQSQVPEDITTFKGGMEYAVARLKAAYPDSEIVLMTPNFLGLCEDGTQDLNGYVLEDLVDTVLALSRELKVKCIDVFHGLDINPTNKLTYLADMCHPNELGRFEIGRLVFRHLAQWQQEASMVTGQITERVGYGALADQTENLENNAFFDSLVYTGYNIEKHRSDGLMWYYVLAANKRGKGWLSDITYNGGSTGYETKDGEPDISFFEDYGLVCASYATYVYFNYLPNIAGVDTGELAKPEKAYNANDWYIATKDWIDKGYSKTISFEASLKGGFIEFQPEEEIPIGSIIAFCDAKNKSDYCSHIVIYAGYQNDYHWVYHVGNENGPEFCSVERMHFGPDPQWPIGIITTPNIVVDALQ